MVGFSLVGLATPANAAPAAPAHKSVAAGCFDGVRNAVSCDDPSCDSTNENNTDPCTNVPEDSCPQTRITSSSLPDGVVGTYYFFAVQACSTNGGEPSWTASALPTGLTFDTTAGVIEGTPTSTFSNPVCLTVHYTEGGDDYGFDSQCFDVAVTLADNSGGGDCDPTAGGCDTGGGLSAPCLNTAGVITDCSNTDCDPIQSQLAKTKGIEGGGNCGQSSTSSGGGGGAGWLGGSGCGTSGCGSLGSGGGTDPNTRPTDVGQCVNINPISFKFDIPCIWAWLFTPSLTLQTQVSNNTDILFNQRQPFSFFNSTIQEGVTLLTVGTCDPMTTPFSIPSLNIHIDFPLFPCITGFRDVIYPMSTWISWITIVTVFGPWLWKKVDFSFNAEGGS